jgi:hypothetical protein
MNYNPDDLLILLTAFVVATTGMGKSYRRRISSVCGAKCSGTTARKVTVPA